MNKNAILKNKVALSAEGLKTQQKNQANYSFNVCHVGNILQI